MKRYGYIYKITHTPTKRYYIGQHKSSEFDDSYWGSGRVIQNLYKKHPKEEFTREVLAWAETSEELNNLEMKFVDVALLKQKKCLNRRTGGNVGILSEETKQKLSESHKGQKAWNKGISPSKEMREKLRQANLGKKHSKETLEKMSKSLKGKNLGKKRTEEQRKHISEAHKGYKHTEEWKKNMSERMKGRVITEEWKQKIREARLRRIQHENAGV